MVSQTLGKLSEVSAAENVKHGVWQSANGITTSMPEATLENSLM
jgi:hypothetical protein